MKWLVFHGSTQDEYMNISTTTLLYEVDVYVLCM